MPTRGLNQNWNAWPVNWKCVNPKWLCVYSAGRRNLVKGCVSRGFDHQTVDHIFLASSHFGLRHIDVIADCNCRSGSRSKRRSTSRKSSGCCPDPETGGGGLGLKVGATSATSDCGGSVIGGNASTGCALQFVLVISFTLLRPSFSFCWRLTYRYLILQYKIISLQSLAEYSHFVPCPFTSLLLLITFTVVMDCLSVLGFWRSSLSTMSEAVFIQSVALPVCYQW